MPATEALLQELGMEGEPFLAPYNIYVHIKLNMHRSGFPHHARTMLIDRGVWRESDLRIHLHLPRTTKDYCHLLNEQGPPLILFYGTPPLSRCPPNYNSHVLSPTPTHRHALRTYFLREPIN